MNPAEVQDNEANEKAEADVQSGDQTEGDAMEVDQEQPLDQTPGGAQNTEKWKGIRSDIGILTEKQFQTIVTKCIATLGKTMPQSRSNAVFTSLIPRSGSPVGGDLAMAAGADTPAVSRCRTHFAHRLTL